MEAISLLGKSEKSDTLAAESSLRLARTLHLLNSDNCFLAFKEIDGINRTLSSGDVGVASSTIPSLSTSDAITPLKVAECSRSPEGTIQGVNEYPVHHVENGVMEGDEDIKRTQSENILFVHRLTDRSERTLKAVDLIEKAISMPNLTILQKVEYSLAGAYLFRQFGLFKKFSFLLFRTVSLYIEAGDVDAAVHVLVLLSKLNSQAFQDNVSQSRETNVDNENIEDDTSNDKATWVFLSRTILGLLAKYSLEKGTCYTYHELA